MRAGGLVVTALWQAYLLAGPFGRETVWMAVPGIAFLAAVAALWCTKRLTAFISGAALLVLPAAWTLSVLFAPGNLMLPSSSLARWLGVNDGRGILLSRTFSNLSDDPKLHDFLLAHRGDARFLAVTPSTRLAAPLIIRTGQPVLAAGGFSGNDPILTIEALALMVERGEIRFVLLPSVTGAGRGANAPSRQRDFIRWVRANGVPVKDELWRSLPAETRRSIALYDLAPGAPQGRGWRAIPLRKLCFNA
jgi:4-amino-4-deoxy-L-arabinose transferase-like glycosyltransferase